MNEAMCITFDLRYSVGNSSDDNKDTTVALVHRDDVEGDLRCRYKSGKCTQERSFKDCHSLERHTLCCFHRAKHILAQRRSDEKNRVAISNRRKLRRLGIDLAEIMPIPFSEKPEADRDVVLTSFFEDIGMEWSNETNVRPT